MARARRAAGAACGPLPRGADGAQRGACTADIVAATLVDVQSDAEGAQRFARLLISEIKLYHEAQVDEGRRARDLRQRLHAHIERARQLYEERVPSDLRARTDYFEQELVRTLADGDPILLGQAS